MPPTACSPDLTRHVDVVRVREEGVLVALPQRDVGVTSVRRDAHERLWHEARKSAELAANLLADLPEGREVVGRLLGPVEEEVELDLAGRVLVIALDHVQPELLPVLDHLVDDRLELRKLVDVVAVRLRHALDRGRSVGTQLEPHHLRLHPGPQVHPRCSFELLLYAAQVSAAVRGEHLAWPFAVLAVAKARAPDSGNPRIPGQDLERLGLRYSDELPGLGPVADVVAVAIGEEIRGRAVDELEALLGDRLPVRRRNPLAHDAAGDGDELVVDVRHALGVDLLADLLHQRPHVHRLRRSAPGRSPPFLLSPARRPACAAPVIARSNVLASVSLSRVNEPRRRSPDRRSSEPRSRPSSRSWKDRSAPRQSRRSARPRVRRPVRELRVPRGEKRARPARAPIERCSTGCSTRSSSSTNRRARRRRLDRRD